MAEDKRRFDVRTIERRLREGIVSREDYQQHLDDLPDVADKAEPMESEFVEGVLADDEEQPPQDDGEDVE